MDSTKKIIGILGGMGPVASVDLYHRIIKVVRKTYHAKQDYEFPPMLLYNLPLVGFNESGFVRPELVKMQLIKGVQKLERAGSDFIVIACNTVHYFHDEMQAAVHIPIVHLIEETAERVWEKGYQVIGLLTSESTKRLGLYEQAMRLRGIATLAVSEVQQKHLNRVILHIMAGTVGKCDIDMIQAIISDFYARGAQSVVLGCTELPTIISQDDVQMELFDSTTILAEAAVHFAMAF